MGSRLRSCVEYVCSLLGEMSSEEVKCVWGLVIRSLCRRCDLENGTVDGAGCLSDWLRSSIGIRVEEEMGGVVREVVDGCEIDCWGLLSLDSNHLGKGFLEGFWVSGLEGEMRGYVGFLLFSVVLDSGGYVVGDILRSPRLQRRFGVS